MNREIKGDATTNQPPTTLEKLDIAALEAEFEQTMVKACYIHKLIVDKSEQETREKLLMEQSNLFAEWRDGLRGGPPPPRQSGTGGEISEGQQQPQVTHRPNVALNAPSNLAGSNLGAGGSNLGAAGARGSNLGAAGAGGSNFQDNKNNRGHGNQ